ncbi:MAG TPA: low molecular weight protein-tyrosine-phosphatase [Flavipsychrobacter sp.]|nr:low molecular weight protein-tyrosine-phosphatase [Flavipsychrobacter sp.]
MRILFVCLGNICRSPIAEGVMRNYIREHQLDWEVASAGTESYHIGEAPHKYSRKICLSNGVDISMQRARRFQMSDLRQFDKVYAMSGDVYDIILSNAGSSDKIDNLDLFLNELKPGLNESVPDPWYGDERGYVPVYEMIAATCQVIIEKYK